VRPYLKNNKKQEWLGEWLKWLTLASATPSPSNNNSNKPNPKYFINFDAIFSEIVSLTSFLDCSLLETQLIFVGKYCILQLC
jgi:hypothetical protein